MKVLVVDNDPAVCEYMNLILGDKSHTVLTAEDGLDALEKLINFDPAVIFIDLVMPNIDGKKLCQILRKNPKYDRVFLVVLSAISTEEDINFRELGFNACIAKGPLRKVGELVVELMEKIESDSRQFHNDEVLGLEDLYKREITKELLSSKRHADLIIANMTEGIVEVTETGRVVLVNPSACVFFGKTEEQLLAADFVSLFPEKSRSRVLKEFKKSNAGGVIDAPPVSMGQYELTLHFLTVLDFDSSYRICIMKDMTKILEAEKVLRGINKECEEIVRQRTKELDATNISLKKEIKEREAAEEVLAQSLKDKDVLLKEVHHRVKNNLQIINSLLGLQSRRIEDRVFKDIYRETQERVRSIALVHEKLYQSRTLSDLNIEEYLSSLVNGITRSFGDSRGNITIDVSVDAENIGIDTAVPLGLIVNELVSNAMKYAFSEGEKGDIHVSFHRKNAGEKKVGKQAGEESNYRLLTISDNGHGMPTGFNVNDSGHLGLKIVQTLVHQLKGEMKYNARGGTEIVIIFPLK